MDTTPSFNIEYLLLRAYDFLIGFHFGSAVPAWTLGTIQALWITGMVLTLIFVVLLVYAQIKLLVTEHEGFHGKEAEHHEHSEEAHPAEPKNSRFERIMELAAGPSEGDWRRAILEADIMLGDALAAAGYEGASVGEQLKMTNPIQLTTLDLAWKAHKIRNDVAHGGESYQLTEREVRVAIDYYRRVFEELGAI